MVLETKSFHSTFLIQNRPPTLHNIKGTSNPITPIVLIKNRLKGPKAIILIHISLIIIPYNFLNQNFPTKIIQNELSINFFT